MIALKSAAWALLAAAVTEGMATAVFLGFGRIGGDGPNTVGLIALILHAPGIILADHLRLVGAIDTVVITLTGFLQYFLVFWIIIAIILRRRARKTIDHPAVA